MNHHFKFDEIFTQLNRVSVYEKIKFSHSCLVQHIFACKSLWAFGTIFGIFLIFSWKKKWNILSKSWIQKLKKKKCNLLANFSVMGTSNYDHKCSVSVYRIFSQFLCILVRLRLVAISRPVLLSFCLKFVNITQRDDGDQSNTISI